VHINSISKQSVKVEMDFVNIAWEDMVDTVQHMAVGGVRKIPRGELHHTPYSFSSTCIVIAIGKKHISVIVLQTGSLCIS
jgi:hypothetical protein